MAHRDTLEELVFQTTPPGMGLDILEEEEENHKRKLDLRAFPKLRVLKLLLYVLFDENEDYSDVDLPSLLPPTLEHLLIGAITEKQLRSVIAGCRKSGQFERLRYLTVSEDEGRFSEDEKQALHDECHRLATNARLEFLPQWQGLPQYIA